MEIIIILYELHAKAVIVSKKSIHVQVNPHGPAPKTNIKAEENKDC